jgi:hypothetical protein
MGNFSTDPNARAADATSKQYVGVHIQQAVPLLDADLNLLDDLRRLEHEALGQWFIGGGVPSGSDGFRISANPAGSDVNDFAIQAGLCLVGGKLVRSDANFRYTTQPAFGNPRVVPPLPPLTAPAGKKDFIVYVDAFEREVDGQEDTTLVDARIGIETAVRLKREWAVRVAREPEDLPLLDVPPPGHAFLRLARLHRTSSTNITGDMIDDLRETQLSILRRIEVRDNAGIVLVDNARFKHMLEITSKNVLAFIQYITTKFNAFFFGLTAAEVLGLEAAAHVAHTAQAGLSNVNALTFTNQTALAYLRQLYTAQQNFMTVWSDFVLQLGVSVKKYASYAVFVSDLDQRLNTPTVGTRIGLLPALDAGNLAAAVDMQEEIARLIGLAGLSVARGTIRVSYSNAPPGNLIVGSTVRLQFRVTSFATQADTYTVTIRPPTGWPRVLVDGSGTPIPGNKVPVPASGGDTILFVDVTVQAGSSDLQLRLVSDSNPAEIDQSTGLITLTAGQPAPPGEDKVQFNLETPFNAVIDNALGVVKLSRPPAPQPGSIGVRIFNNTGQSATFTLAVEVVAGTAVGTWTVALAGPNGITLPDGGNDKPGGINITVAGDAVSCQLRYTATATIAGATVVTQRIIPCTAN